MNFDIFCLNDYSMGRLRQTVKEISDTNESNATQSKNEVIQGLVTSTTLQMNWQTIIFL